MGFKCPKCHQDFGLDKSKLDEHLENNPKCAAEAFVNTEIWKVSVGIKKAKISTRCDSGDEPKRRRTYKSVSPNHHWVKQNLVSNDDGSDTMLCTRCGLKAKRFGSSMGFDMRYIHKIENCID